MEQYGTYTKSPGIKGLLQRAIKGGKSGYDFHQDYGSGESVDYGESPSDMYDEEGRPIEWANPNQPQQFDPDARAMPINVNEMMIHGNAYGNMDALIEQNKSPLNQAMDRMNNPTPIGKVGKQLWPAGTMANAGLKAIESLRNMRQNIQEHGSGYDDSYKDTQMYEMTNPDEYYMREYRAKGGA
tara:strand:+ start:74 stop:625 length:552 start_codon:yes stop_codon:yes gene_type:complete